MFRRIVIQSLAALLLLGLSVSAYNRSEFLFLDEIEIGMTGIGKTIVAGDVLSEFDVEVLGILDQPGVLSDFIVVRVSGEAIGRSGGIAQGMSGSPVYIGGKLVGAVSRAAQWSKEITPIALVTPIEPMLAVLDGTKTVAAANEDAVLRDVSLADGSKLPGAAVAAAAPDTIFSAPVAAPLVTAGLSERAREALMNGTADLVGLDGQEPTTAFLPSAQTDPLMQGSDGLSSLGLALLPLAAQEAPFAAPDAASLEPGSGLGVALATGDITIGALGTLTYREGDFVIGFGHAFVSNGASQFPLTTVSIVDTIKALDASFKLGTIGSVVGTISEDRTAAIGGRIGSLPETIDTVVGVYDLDQHQTAGYNVQVVNEPALTPDILLAAELEAVDASLDRIGQGTIEMTVRITGDGMPRPLERRDVFLSTRDIAVYPALQVASLVSYLQYNEFADPGISLIETSMQITKEIRAIRISDFEIDAGIYAPGDTVRFRATLQTYQGGSDVVEGELAIPDDLLSDTLVVRVYGGPRYLEAGEAPRPILSLEELLDAIEEIPSYDRLTVELFAVDPFSPYADALYGIGKATFDYPGYVIYDEREVGALLISPSDSGSPEW